MSTQPINQDNYTYPQFVIDEKTGQIVVNFIDGQSGRIVRHISAQKLSKIVRDQHFARGFNSGQ
jgi:uncharacterized FlaG/YvyC family protein